MFKIRHHAQVLEPKHSFKFTCSATKKVCGKSSAIHITDLSGQEANESGAKLIGTATGFSCLPYNPLGYEKYEISQLKGLVINTLIKSRAY